MSPVGCRYVQRREVPVRGQAQQPGFASGRVAARVETRLERVEAVDLGEAPGALVEVADTDNGFLPDPGRDGFRGRRNRSSEQAHDEVHGLEIMLCPAPAEVT